MRNEISAPRLGRAPFRHLAPAILALAVAQLTMPPMVSAQEAAAPQSAPPVRLPPLPPGVAELPDVVARVNGEEITKRELIAQAQTMRMQAMEAGADPAQDEDFLELVLEALIHERLVYLDSEARGVGPTDAEVDERMQSVIAAYGGEPEFEAALKQQGLDRQYVRRQVKQTLSFDKLMDREIVPNLEVGEEAIAAYYERYKEQMKVPAYFKVRHIMKVVPEGAGAEALAAARAQLEALREQIEGGANLAHLARVHSDDERSRDKGGELPWIVLTGREDNFEPTVAALAVGELSVVVETQAGLHLIRLEDKKPARTKTLDEARGDIRNLLGAVEARREIQRRVEALKANARIEILI